MSTMQAHGFRTALEVLLEPHPDEHCPYFGGWLEVWLLTPLEVGLCTVTGEVCHIGKRWTRDVCTHNKFCPFKTKIGNTPGPHSAMGSRTHSPPPRPGSYRSHRRR